MSKSFKQLRKKLNSLKWIAFHCAFPSCKIDAHQKCTGCFKVYYCSKEHQEQDWENHQSACFDYPYRLITVYGPKVLFAAKEIRAGETIFKETSILSGPSCILRPWENPARHVKVLCLACYKHIHKIKYRCSTCQWPVCDAVCEKEDNHANGECKFLTLNHTPPQPIEQLVTIDGRNIYENILTLRALLLRLRDYAKWEMVLNLNSAVEHRDMNTYIYTHQGHVVRFIHKDCDLNKIPHNIIRRVFAICMLNARRPDLRDFNWPRNSAFLFHLVSFTPTSHSQNSNVDLIAVGKNEIQIQVRSICTVETDEPVELPQIQPPPPSGFYPEAIYVQIDAMRKAKILRVPVFQNQSQVQSSGPSNGGFGVLPGNETVKFVEDEVGEFDDGNEDFIDDGTFDIIDVDNTEIIDDGVGGLYANVNDIIGALAYEEVGDLLVDNETGALSENVTVANTTDKIDDETDAPSQSGTGAIIDVTTSVKTDDVIPTYSH